MTKYAYPLLFSCHIPKIMPCPSRGAEKLCVRTLEDAANHRAMEITVPKKGIYLFFRLMWLVGCIKSSRGFAECSFDTTFYLVWSN